MNQLGQWAGKRLKLFFVEMDDDDRERVMSCHVEFVEISSNPEYDSIYSDDYLAPVKKYLADQNVTLTAKMVPQSDGTYLRLENFSEMEEEE